MNNAAVLINGLPGREIDIADRGLMYGDGVFETMAFIDGRIRHFALHMKRLNTACELLGFPAPSEQDILSDITQLNLPTPSGPLVIKLIVTRGCGGAGYAPPPNQEVKPTRIVIPVPWPQTRVDQSDGLTCDFLRTSLGSSSMIAGMKHLNRIEQVLAARELMASGLDEGLLLNHEGFVIEAVSSNVLFVFGDKIVTPKLEMSGVKGIARQVIMERAAQCEIVISEEFLFADTVATADEIILCNSIRGLRPVRLLGNVEYSQRTTFYLLNNLWSD